MKMRRRKKTNSNPMEMSNELSENVMMIRNERFEETKRKNHRRKKRNDYAKINANTVFLCVAQIFDAIVKTTW